MVKDFSLIDIEDVAKHFLSEISGHKVIAVYGDMGAGKTTFVHAVCRLLGVKENMSSPTFPIINEYQTSNGKQIHHVDVYRLNSITEAIEAGVEESIYTSNLCFIEWPQIIEPLLPDEILELSLKKLDDTTRQISTKVANYHIRLKS
ncbi:MAG: tRNA (adenosine(37)-N6)-threonylcarbamoyltransferase complex ATPase subunit type 1 TsaE [Ginsengibacter sp.]